MNNAMRKLGDVRLVCDQHNSISAGVELIEKGHDFEARLGVEVAGRLVGQDDRRMLTRARAMATRWR